MKCEICGKDFINNRIGSHINRIHHISSKDYYDKYYKQQNEGICLNCRKLTKFLGLTIGYRKYCSRICCNTSKDHINKMKNTTIKRYGGLGTASKQINAKIKNTNMKKYGAENLYASEYGKNKIIQTSLKKYGTKYPNQSEEVKNKIIQTSMNRYGITNPGNSRIGRLKASKTMTLNGHRSSWEDYFENQCIKLNINFIANYNLDPRYPFYADFYLPDTDTFIEINGFWSHGKHWFNEKDEKDLKILNKWKEKANAGHKQYINAIDVWTVRDKEKHEYAIKNNLNYEVFWTYDELVNYFKNKE